MQFIKKQAMQFYMFTASIIILLLIIIVSAHVFGASVVVGTWDRL